MEIFLVNIRSKEHKSIEIYYGIVAGDYLDEIFFLFFS